MTQHTLRNLAVNLRRLRGDRTQQNLAFASGVKQEKISDIERQIYPNGCSITTNTLDRLADALGVTTPELLDTPR